MTRSDITYFIAIPAILLGLIFTAMNDGTSPDLWAAVFERIF